MTIRRFQHKNGFCDSTDFIETHGSGMSYRVTRNGHRSEYMTDYEKRALAFVRDGHWIEIDASSVASKEGDWIHISMGGPDRFITDANGKEWKFEMHHYCGPSVLTKNGEIAARQPGAKSPFWHAVTHWAQQGEKVDDRGRCLWDEPKPERLVHLGGRHYKVVKD